MATNQEIARVECFEIRLMADDCAPDAEHPYFVWKRYKFTGTKEAAEEHGAYWARHYRMCGVEIFNFPVTNGCTATRVSGFYGLFDEDDN